MQNNPSHTAQSRQMHEQMQMQHNQMQPYSDNHMSSPGTMATQAPSGGANAGGYHGDVGCMATMPNGPMDRERPMEDSRQYGHQAKSNGGNHDSFSSHNMKTQNNVAPSPSKADASSGTHNMKTQANVAAPYLAPSPSKAEASTMMSTAFLKRNCPHMQSHREDGGEVEFKIETVNEECQVSENYKDSRDDYNSDREASRRDYHRQDDHCYDDRLHDDHHNRSGENHRDDNSDRQTNRRDDHRSDDRRDDRDDRDDRDRRDDRHHDDRHNRSDEYHREDHSSDGKSNR